MTIGTLYTILSAIGITALGIAALLAVIRIARGPSILDRVVATDVLIAISIAGLVIEEVINSHTTTLPVILVLSLIGFAGAVSVARLVAAREAPRMAVRNGNQQGLDGRGGPDDQGTTGERR